MAKSSVADLALPDKPSIAVLPFDNMSTDPEQAFFAEGISEDIITELSKFRYEEGLDWARRAQRQSNTALWAFLPEVSALALLERTEEAEAALDRARQLQRDVSVRFVDHVLPITDTDYRSLFVGGLIKAGMPE